MRLVRKMGTGRIHAQATPGGTRTLCGLAVSDSRRVTWVVMQVDQKLTCPKCLGWLEGAAARIVAELDEAFPGARG